MIEENEHAEVENHNGYVEEEDEEISSGDLFMIKRFLGNQAKEEESNQRETLFYTRCLVQGNVCSLIIDGGSCTNAASTRLVSKLELETKPRPRSYKLQWLNENVEMLVDKQVDVCFKIGKYEDVVLCDVVPMEASHLFLGIPWQFDRSVLHDGRTNKYSFMHFGQKISLAPLSPSEVREDQKKMKEKYELEKRKKETEKSKEKKESLLEKKGEFQEANKQPLYLLLCKKVALLINTQNLSSCTKFLLQECEDVFPKKVPQKFKRIVFEPGGCT